MQNDWFCACVQGPCPEHDTPYKQGREWFVSKASVKDNPYCPPGPAYVEWERGWTEAFYEASGKAGRGLKHDKAD